MNIRTFLVYTADKEIQSLYSYNRIKYTIMTRGYVIIKRSFWKNLINRVFKTSFNDISLDIKIEQNRIIPEFNYDRELIFRELENERFRCDDYIMRLRTNDPSMAESINQFIKECRI